MKDDSQPLINRYLGPYGAPFAVIISLITLVAQFKDSADTIGWRVIAWLAFVGCTIWCSTVLFGRRPSAFDNTVKVSTHSRRTKLAALSLTILSMLPAAYAGYLTLTQPSEEGVPDLTLKLNNTTQSDVALTSQALYTLNVPAANGFYYTIDSGVLYLAVKDSKETENTSILVPANQSAFIIASFADPQKHLGFLKSREAILDGMLYKMDGVRVPFGSISFTQTDLSKKYIVVDLK